MADSLVPQLDVRLGFKTEKEYMRKLHRHNRVTTEKRQRRFNGKLKQHSVRGRDRESKTQREYLNIIQNFVHRMCLESIFIQVHTDC